MMQQFVNARKNGATKADKTRARLIEVTKRLFHEYGTDGVTLRSIAASARMKAGSIYYHFNSKDEIIRAVLESGVGGARVAVLRAIAEAGPDSSPLVRFRAALSAHLNYTIKADFSTFRTIRRLPKRLRDHHMKQEREYAAIFAGLLQEAQKKGLLRPGLNLSVARMLSMGALTWVAEWYDPKGPMTPDEIAEEMMGILGSGIIRQRLKL
jgi:TetR/AcrR family transcriptional regulator, cholesterol catabolism regulator